MLERLRIQNFKSWQDTGVFGPNSSDKSSIFHFSLMLKQLSESSNRSRVLHVGDDKSFYRWLCE